MKVPDSQLFTEWTDKVKEESRLSLAAISEKAGMNKHTLNSYRTGRATVKLKHFNVIANQFPTILKEEAAVIGIDVEVKDAITVDRLREILDELRADNSKMAKTLDELKLADTRHKEQAETIKRLLDMLDKHQ